MIENEKSIRKGPRRRKNDLEPRMFQGRYLGHHSRHSAALFIVPTKFGTLYSFADFRQHAFPLFQDAAAAHPRDLRPRATWMPFYVNLRRSLQHQRSSWVILMRKQLGWTYCRICCTQGCGRISGHVPASLGVLITSRHA